VGAVLFVAAGGAIGAAARYGVNIWSARILGTGFPWHTLFVNAVGCFIMGLLFGLVQTKLQVSDNLRLFLTTGILGGFTTFSAFSLDALQLFQRGAVVSAASYVVASVALSLAGVYVGFMIAKAFA
jgi:fluoride exporter